jgi:hypothetical protein
MRLGGPPLLELGLTLRRNQRGQYRKTTERENTDRLLFLLIMLLVKNSQGVYGTPESPIWLTSGEISRHWRSAKDFRLRGYHDRLYIVS